MTNIIFDAMSNSLHLVKYCLNFQSKLINTLNMKRSYIFLLFFAAFFLVVSCKKEKKEATDESTTTETEVLKEESEKKVADSGEKKVMVKLEPKSGSEVDGNVIFKQNGDVVTMIAVMSGLNEGTHAIHLHETADCSAADGTSTGGHWNPLGQPHGKFGDEKGYHKGDIGNFEANADGNGTITFITKEWCIGCEDETKNILGKAIIVHQGSDDFQTQPTGAAGGRISCGGIIE